MTTNDSLHHRYKAIMAPYLNPLYTSPISIDRGEGSYVWDVEGNQYLDSVSYTHLTLPTNVAV